MSPGNNLQTVCHRNELNRIPPSPSLSVLSALFLIPVCTCVRLLGFFVFFLCVSASVRADSISRSSNKSLSLSSLFFFFPSHSKATPVSYRQSSAGFMSRTPGSGCLSHERVILGITATHSTSSTAQFVNQLSCRHSFGHTSWGNWKLC